MNNYQENYRNTMYVLAYAPSRPKRLSQSLWEGPPFRVLCVTDSFDHALETLMRHNSRDVRSRGISRQVRDEGVHITHSYFVLMDLSSEKVKGIVAGKSARSRMQVQWSGVDDPTLIGIYSAGTAFYRDGKIRKIFDD